MSKPLPSEDLDHILTHTRDIFASLDGARIFITGGTGFFGHWLLESLLHAIRELHLNIRATVLTRNALAFTHKAPHIAQDPAITLLEGDMRTFTFPTEPHTHILHAATDSTVRTTEADLAASILAGTQRILAFASHSQLGTRNPQLDSKPLRLLFISSGAVYGRNITRVPSIAEDFPLPTTPAIPGNYDEAKRAAEALCLQAPVDPVIARCFAFVGPHLPLDQHFAIGNFIRDALAGTPIHIKGDGTPLRSFLYMSDLAIWLWTMLANAEPNRAYNVGSDESVSIADLAYLVAATLSPGLPVQIDGTPNLNTPPPTYVPEITRAQTELNLRVTIRLAEAIRRTAAWHS